MDNKDYKSMCEIIDKMSFSKLLSQKKYLQAVQNYPLAGDDKASDIAISLWMDRVDRRITELQKREPI